MIPGFPKIFALGDRNTANLFEDEIEITEKIDGSQFSFGKRTNGIVEARSKNCAVHPHDGNKMFNKATAFVEDCERRGALDDFQGYVFHGEYLQSARHNTLEYDRVPLGNFMLYGVRGQDGELIADYDRLIGFAERLECEVVPLLYRGRIEDAPGYDPAAPFGWFEKLIDRGSVLGKAKIEGVVIKNYVKRPVYGGQELPLLCGKFVSEQFKEKHKVAWPANNPGTLEKLGAMLNAQARWHKAVQHLREKGELTDTPKDIGPLLREINLDIVEEEQEFIKDKLFELFRKDVLRLATKGFPEWYKSELARSIVDQHTRI